MTPVKPKRTLRKKKEVAPPAPQPQVGDSVTLTDGTVVQVAAIGASPAAPVSPNADIPQSRQAATQSEEHNPPNKLGNDVPTAEELRAFRARNAEYSGVHLKKGNMQPLDGVGGNHQQLTAYYQKCIPNFTGATQLTKNQWSTVLDKLDEVRENKGFEGLVQHVQEAITGG